MSSEPSPVTQGPIEFVLWCDLLREIPLSRSQLCVMINKNRFPAPVKLGARRSAFVRSQIEAWKARQVKGC
jgi:predicted DNA-binding transcriptional regulator AlpA